MKMRSRAWCYTHFNYTSESLTWLRTVQSTYHLMGKEKCPETGTPHIQGYIYFSNAKTITSVKKKLWPGCHLEIAKGTPLQNYKYCTKGKEFEEIGTCPQQGKRTDLDRVKQAVTNGSNMREMLPELTSYQGCKTAELYLKYFERKREWQPQVIWIYGPSGVGKTRKAYELCKDPYMSMNGKWWDGYDAHEHVIIDDIRSETYPLTYLLRLTDRYPFTVETKGGTRQFLAKLIVITCPKSPEHFFDYVGEDSKQLIRRITNIIYL